MLQDIEAVDPEYYKNLRWMLENNITDVLDLTFTEESDYFGKKELVELKPGGKDIRSALLLSPLHLALGSNDRGGKGEGNIFWSLGLPLHPLHPAFRVHVLVFWVAPNTLFYIPCALHVQNDCVAMLVPYFSLHTTCPVSVHAHANADTGQVVWTKTRKICICMCKTY